MPQTPSSSNLSTQNQATETGNILSRQVRLPAFMPFFWLAIAAVVGAFVADVLHARQTVWLIALAVCLVLFILDLVIKHRQNSPRRLSIFLILATLCLSALLYTRSLPQNTPQFIGYYTGKGKVGLTGLVVKPVIPKPKSNQLIVRVESLNAPQMDTNAHYPDGLLLVEVPPGETYRYGDRLSIHGELNEPPEGLSFSYRQYLSRKGIYAMSKYNPVRKISSGHGSFLLQSIYALREHSSKVLQNNFPNPESALLRGILLGDESGITSELEDAYARTGTSHIIAISGFNMAVLAGVISLLLRRRLNRWKGSLVAIGVLAFYTIFVGASPAVTRAFFMSAFAIMGSSIARRGNLLNSLGLSVLVMVLWNPQLPWDIGFQFSVMATLGLSLYATPIQACVEDKLNARLKENHAKNLASFVSETFFLTLIAQVMVLPLHIYHFRQFSWLFLIANPLILPLQPLVMILGLIALVGGLIFVPLGHFLSWLAWPFVAYTNSVVRILAKLAPEVWHLPPFSPLWLGLYYALLAVLSFRKKSNTNLKPLWQPTFLLIALASLSIALAVHLKDRPDGKLNLKVFGGSEQALVLMRSPRGEFVLSGGYKESTALAEEISKALPAFEQKIAYVIIPACNKAALNGFYGLPSQITISEVLWACDPESTASSQALYSFLEDAHLTQTRLTENLLLQWEGGEIRPYLNEHGLSRLAIQHKDFMAFVDYQTPGAQSIDEKPSLWIGQVTANSPCAEITLNTASTIVSGTPQCSGVDVSVPGKEWLAISTDGTKVWLRGK